MKKIVLVLALLMSINVGAQERSADEIAAMKEDDSKTSDSKGSGGTHSGHFVLGAYVNTLNEMKFKDAKSTTGSTTTPAEYTLKTGASLGIDAHFLFWGENSWGFSVGGFFDLSHKINEESMAIFGTTKDAYLGIIGFEGNAIYRFDRFYIPLGINTAFPIVAVDTGEVKDIEPGVGLQAGVGYLLGSSKSNALEAKVRTSAFGYTQTINNVKLETDRGTGVGITLGWKYIF
jgi:hypothetical protein